MKLNIRHFLTLCFLSLSFAGLNGDDRQVNTPVRSTESLQDRRQQTSPPQQGDSSRPSPHANQPHQVNAPHPRASVQAGENYLNTPQRQQATPARPQQSVVNKPEQRPVNLQRPAAAIQRTAQDSRPASRVLLETPRPLPARPLPSVIQLDRRCGVYGNVMLRPYTIASKGDVIELVDGSVWHITRKRDRRKVRNWGLWDDILIESTNFITWTSFRLVNYTRGESIEVSYTVGPAYDGHASHWITRVDPLRRQMVLEDGSVWSFMDYKYNDWQANDAIIIGLSKDTSGDYVYVLINTRTRGHTLALKLP